MLEEIKRMLIDLDRVIYSEVTEVTENGVTRKGTKQDTLDNIREEWMFIVEELEELGINVDHMENEV